MKFNTLSKAACVLFFSVLAGSANASLMFSATLSGDQEVPPVATSASGLAMGQLTGTPGAYVFTYQIDYMGLSSPIRDIAGGGHFHNAPAGANGPVVHLFDTASFAFLGTTSGQIIGDWRYSDATNPLTDTLADELVAGNIYINLHTESFASGELRGQVTQVPEPAPLALMFVGVVLLLRRFNTRFVL